MIVPGSASPLLLSSVGGYNLTKSLRFRSSASAYLSRTFASAGNRRTYTLSLWLKRGSLGGSTNQFFFGSGVSTTAGGFYFLPTDQLEINPRVNNTNTYITTTQVFRDPSAWYHIVIALDTTQATNSNRLKLYINGVQVTAFSATIYPALNGDSTLNNNIEHWIGRYPEPGFPSPFDGYLAEYNFIDGQALTPSSFGTTSDLGVWQPIRYGGSYGTNGFYLPFTNTTSTTTLVADSSPNGNNWTPNNISLTSGSTYDSMNDVPTLTSATTANYAVLNPLNKASNITITNGNLLATNAVGAIENVRSTMPTAGTLSYWEYTATTVGSSLRMEFGGILSSYNQSVSNTSYLALTGPTGTFGAFWNSGLALYVNGSSVFTNGSANIVANDVIQFAHDSSTGKLWLGLNGTWYNSGNPAVGTGNVATLTAETVFPAMMMNGGGGTNAASANFGQRPFAYTPPTGFVALNTYNLPTPTIGATASTLASKYFNAVLRNGYGSSGGTLDCGFQPDWVWEKTRSAASSHTVWDSVRGLPNAIRPNETTTELSQNWLTGFVSNGLTFGTNDYGTGVTLVEWVWKANQGTNVTNTSGTITSTVSANTTAGFSIVTYTGSGSAATVGHGLGATPSMVIVKCRSTAYNWAVFHTSLGGGDNALQLNNANAVTSAFDYWNGANTSSVFTLGTDNGVNQSTQTYVAYCFAPVAGYSAFGSYTGNGSTDGPFIFTGFRPRFVMLKVSSGTTANWVIVDTSRNTYNVANSQLNPDAADAEFSGSNIIDIVSNGFKLRNTPSTFNGNGNTYIYAAFAENPFKYANAR